MATDFTPVGNTPEAAVSRGEGFYRLFQSAVPTIDLGDIFFDTTENIVAITVGSRSDVPAATVAFRSKATSSTTTLYVSNTSPWIGLIPSQPAATSPTNTAITITPIPYRMYSSSTRIELYLWYKMPPFLQQARSPYAVTGNADGYSIHLDAGVSSYSQALRSLKYGHRKMSLYAANLEATAVTISLKSARIVYYAKTGATAPASQTATAIYKYTTNGTAMDCCTAVLDIDPFADLTLDFEKTAGVAGDCIYSVWFYD